MKESWKKKKEKRVEKKEKKVESPLIKSRIEMLGTEVLDCLEQVRTDFDRKKQNENEVGSSLQSGSPYPSTSYDPNTKIWIQYGEPRTATTLQFVTLCAISLLLHGPSTRCVHAHPRKGTCYEQVACMRGRNAENSPIVCKTHVLEDALQASATPRAMLFVTGQDSAYNSSDPNSWFSAAQKMEAEWRNNPHTKSWISYVAVTQALATRHDLLVHDYARLFKLSAEQRISLGSFLKPWDKLRVCCGAQMSLKFRERLTGTPFKIEKPGQSKLLHQAKNWNVEKESQNEASDRCEEYDFNSIESRLISTKVFLNAHGVDLITRLSSQDGKLDGSYCSRAKDATVRLNLRFNDKRYLDL